VWMDFLRMFSAFLVPMKVSDGNSAGQISVRIACSSLATLRKTLFTNRLCVRSRNQQSITLIHDRQLGVTFRWSRGCRKYGGDVVVLTIVRRRQKDLGLLN